MLFYANDSIKVEFPQEETPQISEENVEKEAKNVKQTQAKTIVSDSVSTQKKEEKPVNNTGIYAIKDTSSNILLSDSLLKTAAKAKPAGVIPDPLPYTIATDSVITTMFVACLIIGILSISRSKQFIIRQTKNIFRPSKGRTTQINETTSEIKFQIFLAFQAALMMAFLTFLYITQTHPLSQALSPYVVTAELFAIYCSYVAIKLILQTIINATFFTLQANSQWIKAQLLALSFEGVALYPITVCATYLNLPINTAAIITISIMIAVKLILFGRFHNLFFARKQPFPHIILYLCALELVPVAMLAGGLNAFVNFLTTID